MPKPVLLRKILKTLRRKGFVFVLQTGSHAKYRKIGKSTRNVIIKVNKKEVPYGTFKSILIQSGLEEKDFRKE